MSLGYGSGVGEVTVRVWNGYPPGGRWMWP